MESSHELLTSQEVAACLGKSRSTIYRMTREGMLPAKKTDWTWHYSYAEKRYVYHGEIFLAKRC